MSKTALVLGTRSAVIMAAPRFGAMVGNSLPFICILKKTHSPGLKIWNKNLHVLPTFCSFTVLSAALDLVALHIVIIGVLKYIATHCKSG